MLDVDIFIHSNYLKFPQSALCEALPLEVSELFQTLKVDRVFRVIFTIKTAGSDIDNVRMPRLNNDLRASFPRARPPPYVFRRSSAADM